MLMNSKKYIIGGVVCLLLGLLIVSFFFYEALSYGGYNLYLKSRSYVKENIKYEGLLYTPFENTYAGMLIQVSDNKVWVLGKSRIMSFVVEGGADYLVVNACEEGGVVNERLAETEYESLEDWKPSVKNGSYVVVFYNYDNRKKIEKMVGFDYWSFMDDSMEKECY